MGCWGLPDNKEWKVIKLGCWGLPDNKERKVLELGCWSLPDNKEWKALELGSAGQQRVEGVRVGACKTTKSGRC